MRVDSLAQLLSVVGVLRPAPHLQQLFRDARFQGALCAQEAELLLTTPTGSPGTFLLRQSSSGSGRLSISYLAPGAAPDLPPVCRHFQCEQIAAGFRIGGGSASSFGGAAAAGTVYPTLEGLLEEVRRARGLLLERPARGLQPWLCLASPAAFQPALSSPRLQAPAYTFMPSPTTTTTSLSSQPHARPTDDAPVYGVMLTLPPALRSSLSSPPTPVLASGSPCSPSSASLRSPPHPAATPASPPASPPAAPSAAAHYEPMPLPRGGPLASAAQPPQSVPEPTQSLMRSASASDLPPAYQPLAQLQQPSKQGVPKLLAIMPKVTDDAYYQSPLLLTTGSGNARPVRHIRRQTRSTPIEANERTQRNEGGQWQPLLISGLLYHLCLYIRSTSRCCSCSLSLFSFCFVGEGNRYPHTFGLWTACKMALLFFAKGGGKCVNISL
jgi:hypothetical protein